MEIFSVKNLSFTYPNSEEKALENLNFSIEEGSFAVVCGMSGCGKTTLLKMLKRELTPEGKVEGKVYFKGTEISELDDFTAAQKIGYVLQNPDSQIVTDKVWHEMAFGLENLGVETEIIRRRIGEMSSYFGIESLFHKKTDELSGGQKQLLNLASVMVMQPDVLILDEPTSQLDPIAASDFIATLQKMNRELGLTIILVEHRLEDVFPIADSIILIDNGKLLLKDEPKNIASKLKKTDENHPMLLGLPSAVRIFSGLDVNDDCPLTVRDGKMFLSNHFSNNIQKEYVAKEHKLNDNIALKTKNTWFRYERDLPDVLKGIDIEIHKNEVFCILGGNGVGKTTLLHVLSGVNKAYRGKILINDKKIKDYKGNELYRQNLSLLPQNPMSVFLKSTVIDDFDEILKVNDVKREEREKKINEVAEKLEITHLLNKHPYDLSGGEQQKCAIGKLLLSNPKILLLDEPTKGFDPYAKKVLSGIIAKLKNDGITVVIVTHDVEFAATIADRCALFFDGKIISTDTPNKFFGDNNFYTTAANRISRHLYSGAVTCEQVIELCKKNGEVK